MMAKRNPTILCIKKTYGLESPPEYTLTSRLSDQADTPLKNTKTMYPICS